MQSQRVPARASYRRVRHKPRSRTKQPARAIQHGISTVARTENTVYARSEISATDPQCTFHKPAPPLNRTAQPPPPRGTAPSLPPDPPHLLFPVPRALHLPRIPTVTIATPPSRFQRSQSTRWIPEGASSDANRERKSGQEVGAERSFSKVEIGLKQSSENTEKQKTRADAGPRSWEYAFSGPGPVGIGFGSSRAKVASRQR